MFAPISVVKSIYSGMQMSIARTKNKVGLATMLEETILACAQNYCGATNLNDDFLSEAVEFVVSRFYFLGVEEIKNAFRLAAAKELMDIKTRLPIDIKAYAGIFTIETLGTILDAYVSYRKRIEEELSKKIEAAENEENEAQRKEMQETAEWKEKYYEKLIAFLKRNIGLCGVVHYDELTEAGFIVVSNNEKRDYMERAKVTLKVKIASEIEEEGNFFKQVYLKNVMRNDGGDDYQNRLIGEAKHLIVYDFISTIIWCEVFTNS